MTDGTLFIGAVIAGVTQFIKLVAPKVSGALTIAVAVGVGVLIALLDTEIGVVDLSVAEGVLTALGAVGVVAVAEKV